jgi:hypothetical protein
MFSKRSFIAAAICAVALPLAACGSSGGSTPPPPPGVDASTPPPPPAEGTHYTYVVSKAYIPANNGEARDYGFDFGSEKSNMPDGTIDNVLGGQLHLLAAANIDVQAAVTKAIDQGTILLLADLQTTDFSVAATAGFAIKLGDTAKVTPPACTDANDTVCRHHLDGAGQFAVAADSPTTAAVAGKIDAGTFNGGPGEVTLQLAVGGGAPIRLTLHNAHVKTVSPSATAMTATIGGVLTTADVNGQIIPAIQATVAALLDTDCGTTRTPPSCGCTTTATMSALNEFDKSPKDCQITVDEIANDPIAKLILAPDVCSTTTCAKPDALSLGIKVDAVKATIK